MERNWNDQTIAITGAASGLGKALSRHFAGPGAKVLGLDREEADLGRREKPMPGEFFPIVCDVTRCRKSRSNT